MLNKYQVKEAHDSKIPLIATCLFHPIFEN